MKESSEFAALAKILSKAQLFEGMRREELLTLLNLMSKSTYQPGHYVFREGDLGATLYLLASGSVEVQKTRGQKHSVSLALLQPGDTFGEMALVRDQTRCASVQVLEPSRVFSMETKSIWGYPTVAAKLFLNISKVLADRLVIANELLFEANIRKIADEFVPR